jgi:alkylation response protein AidB-like acyl-CoA dehydrogenase
MTIPRLFPIFDAIPAHETIDEAALRAEVRAFVQTETKSGTLVPGRQTWTTWHRTFSLRCAEEGYIAMTMPKRYGGHERSAFERYVVCEELLAAGAPQGSHWIADRQSAPQILRNGSQRAKDEILPKIAAGTCTIGIGMSEPDSGSDLSSIRTRTEKVEGGYRVYGQKVWTTNAQHADYVIALCRTSPRGEGRYDGLSQLIVPMDQPEVTTRPLRDLRGEEELNEITFDGAFVPDDFLLGAEGEGWRLVNEELGFERSGPDRILSTFVLLSTMAQMVGQSADRFAMAEVGRLIARLSAIRQLSLRINRRLSADQDIGGMATIMKDTGTALEQEIPEVARRILDLVPSGDGNPAQAALATAILSAPSFSLRGGTREILKGMIAREMGLR